MRYFIMFAAILVMFGCGEKGEEKAAEEVMEKAIESNMAGNAEVDIEENSLRIQTEEGEMTMTAGDSVQLPADFPRDVFLYKGAVLNTTMELPGGFNLILEDCNFCVIFHIWHNNQWPPVVRLCHNVRPLKNAHFSPISSSD